MPSGTWPARGTPSKVAVPAVAGDSPDSTSSKVDLPQPIGLTTLKNLPAAISRSTDTSECVSRCPSCDGKNLVTPRRLIWLLPVMARPAFDQTERGVDARSEAEQQQRDRQNVDRRMHV